MAQNKTRVMGVLNLTPDSFSDGGCYQSLDAALRHAETLCAEGAEIIDIGGESTRPGASPITEQQELDRILPVIEKISRNIAVDISVDTRRTVVMQAALAYPITMINDVSALSDHGALSLLATYPAIKLCLMHMQGEPATMQQRPQYSGAGVVHDVMNFLAERVEACKAAGIDASRLYIDPGIGFGKTTADNLMLLRELSVFRQLALPIVVGVSRKRFIGDILHRTVDKRLYGGLALSVLASLQGVAVIRTHDVRATVEALTMINAVMSEG